MSRDDESLRKWLESYLVATLFLGAIVFVVWTCVEFPIVIPVFLILTAIAAVIRANYDKWLKE